MGALGSSAHRALIEQVLVRYRDDDRIRAVAVFGSLGTGAWHELSDIDLDVVISDSQADYDLGPRRRALLEQIDPTSVA